MEKIVAITIPAFLAIVGLAIMVIATKVLLSLDRRTGYAIYKRTLESTDNEGKAIRSAGVFYKLFGLAFFLFSTLLYILTGNYH